MPLVAVKSSRLDPKATPLIVELARFALETTPDPVIPAKLTLPERERVVAWPLMKKRFWKVEEAEVEVAEIYPTLSEPMEEVEITALSETKRLVEVACVVVERTDINLVMVEEASVTIPTAVEVGVRYRPPVPIT